jgi:hypothetical protein
MAAMYSATACGRVIVDFMADGLLPAATDEWTRV